MSSVEPGHMVEEVGELTANVHQKADPVTTRE